MATSNRTIEYARIAFISPELIAVLVVFLFWLTTPRFFARFAELVITAEFGSLLTLLGVPCAILFTVYRLGFETLNPPEKKDILVKWPEYWKLKVRIIISLISAILALVGAWLGWYLIDSGRIPGGSLLTVASLALGATTVASVAFARLELRDILHGA